MPEHVHSQEAYIWETIATTINQTHGPSTNTPTDEREKDCGNPSSPHHSYYSTSPKRTDDTTQQTDQENPTSNSYTTGSNYGAPMPGINSCLRWMADQSNPNLARTTPQPRTPRTTAKDCLVYQFDTYTPNTSD